LASTTSPSRFASAASRAGLSWRLGPEVDHDGNLFRALDHVALEVHFGGIDGHE
jgi:hypothetical protein